MKTFVAMAALLVLTACSDQTGANPPEPTGLPPVSSTPSTAPSMSVPSPTTADPLCSPGKGRTVEMLPDVSVPAIEVPAVVDPSSGSELAEGFTIPAQEIDAGCVIRFDAPGGCLGAVTISGATIPPLVIPGTTIGDRVYPAVTVPGSTRPAVTAPQVCRVHRDGEALTASRPGVVREGFSRNGAARPGDDLVPTVRVPAVSLPDVDVDPGRLERRELEETGVGVFADNESVSYVAPAAVLFDTDKSELRPGAVPALQAIAEKIREARPGATLLVEGHGDSRGAADYVMDLSIRRARTVANWLAGAGFDRDLIVVRGYGETKPAYPNDTEANRQKNRRVVITIRK